MTTKMMSQISHGATESLLLRGAGKSERLRPRLPLALVLTGLLAACGGGGGGEDQSVTREAEATTRAPQTPDYFPLGTGDHWVYHYSASDAPVGTLLLSTHQIVGQRVVDQRRATVMAIHSTPSMSEPNDVYFDRSSKALVVLPQDNSDAVAQALGPLDALHFPLIEGDVFIQADRTGLDIGIDIDGDGKNETMDVRSVVRVLGFETLATKAGTFDHCAKTRTVAHQLYHYSAGGEDALTRTTTDWYAPGIGLARRLVQDTYPDGTVFQNYLLMAYTVDGRRSETKAPTVVSVRPKQSATAGGSALVEAIFDEAMDDASIDEKSFAVFDAQHQRVAGTVTYADRVATFLPLLPMASGTYIGRVGRLARDLAGNPLDAERRWTFKVEGTRPAVVATSPLPNARSVSRSAPIEVDFNEPIKPSSVDPYSVAVHDDVNSVPLEFAVDRARLTLTPIEMLAAATTYTVSLPGTITDRYGNALGDPYEWRFTTSGASLSAHRRDAWALFAAPRPHVGTTLKAAAR